MGLYVSPGTAKFNDFGFRLSGSYYFAYFISFLIIGFEVGLDRLDVVGCLGGCKAD